MLKFYLNRHSEYIASNDQQTDFITTGSDKNFMRFAKNINTEHLA